MNTKGLKLALATTLLTMIIAGMGQPVHAWQTNVRGDKASYIPGDVGTLIITVVNDSPTETLEIRNFTVYFPWAGYVDGKWNPQGNVSFNLNPVKVLSTNTGTNPDNIYTYQAPFTIPAWFSGSEFSTNCPGNPTVRYGLYNECVLVGTNDNNLRYENQFFSLAMAIPTYNPPSLVSMAIPIATLVVLVAATAFMFLTWASVRRLELRK